MNVNRTYSLPQWIAEEVKTHYNQSKFVAECIQFKLDSTDIRREVINDLTNRNVMAILLARLDPNDTLALLIRDRLNQSTNPIEPKK